jgi:hypothetical protein
MQNTTIDPNSRVAHTDHSPMRSNLLVEDVGGGFARLRFDQELPWPVVIGILETIKGSTGEA